MIVVDASAAVSALLSKGAARQAISRNALAAPHLIDAEVLHTLRRLRSSDQMTAADADAAVQLWQRLGLQRFGLPGLVPRIWELRHNLTAHDAAYVALAEALDCPLATADARLAAAPGSRCSFAVLPT